MKGNDTHETSAEINLHLLKKNTREHLQKALFQVAA
jgi:hypothetical protein